MPTLSEAFLPTDWDEFETAIAKRNQKAAQLSAQGLVCTCRTLYRITDGMPVYVVDASSPEADPELRRDAKRERDSQTGSRQEPRTRRSSRERTLARKRSPGALEGKLKPKTLGYEET